jgi:hypothetical protein
MKDGGGREMWIGAGGWLGGGGPVGVCMNKKFECGPYRRDMKEHECGEIGNKGRNLDDYDRIFCFEGENKGERVWMVL